jgi:DNA-binding transcriptional ArsR family regulator
LRLKLVESRETQRVSPRDVLDYRAFSQRYGKQGRPNELEVFERFHAANALIREGFETYLDALISDSREDFIIKADMCGNKEGFLTIVFCETGTIEPSLSASLERVDRSQNARAIVISPLGPDLRALQRDLPNVFRSGKVSLESLGWFDDHLDTSLQQTLRLIDLLGNETRMRMLAPLFRRSSGKREFRAMINPKLVYENLSALLDAGLVDEASDGTYELSPMGRTVMAEFISFLEKTRRTLGSITKGREVKLNG